ncbi:MAG: HepT-like ribonuclease domain-containing protein [Bacteroidota bacterium]
MFHSEIEFLKHIRDEAQFILEHTRSLSKEEFLRDEVMKRASTRSLEIIGEAVKSLSKEFRELHPTIEWKKIAGTRDVLIHDYMTVDYELVWDIVQKKIPGLHSTILKILKDRP